MAAAAVLVAAAAAVAGVEDPIESPPVEAASRGRVDGLEREEARQWICGSVPHVEAQGFAMAGAEGRLACLPEG